MRNFFSIIKQKLLRHEITIPYLELPAYEEPITIPYIPLSSSGVVHRTAVTYEPSEIGILDTLFTVYDEFVYLLTQTQSRLVFAATLSLISIYYFFQRNLIVAYGDAESHLNIAKRVISSITPGLSQLGGIWLPVPHIMMIPFVYSDFLWRTGLAGAIVSGLSFIVTSFFLYKLAFFLTKNRLASFVAFLVFALNPNILYLQSTPMTELPLIMFFVLSTYYFVRFLKQDHNFLPLIGAAIFGLAASLSRYDGWFLVLTEALVLFLFYVNQRLPLTKAIGKILLYATPAFFGIFIWVIWGYIILGDPFYFTTSEFSAKSQQQAWLTRGELPSYHNILSSLTYYSYTALTNIGVVTTALALVGFIYYLVNRSEKRRLFIALIALCPFIFNVLTLYLGQSVIFIPPLTPNSFQWTLFNVRYGVMMIPVAAIFFGYLFAASRPGLKVTLLAMLALQTVFFMNHTNQIISLSDGTSGLSRYIPTDAQTFITTHYDSGFVLIDDFSRSISIIRSGIPMENIIYIGNSPYWNESLEHPEKHATWIIMQQNDTLWKSLYANADKQGTLYKYYNKVYTSPQVLIFKKMPETHLTNQKNSINLAEHVEDKN